MRRIALILTGALVVSSGCADRAPVDPPSALIDPPPGPIDYVASLPRDEWTFARLLWQGRDTCTSDNCEAAYNAAPLFLSVMREKECCGGTDVSYTVVARVRDCSAVAYYLAWQTKIGRTKAQRLALVERHTKAMAASILSECHVSEKVDVPTAALSTLVQ